MYGDVGAVGALGDIGGTLGSHWLALTGQQRLFGVDLAGGRDGHGDPPLIWGGAFGVGGTP